VYRFKTGKSERVVGSAAQATVQSAVVKDECFDMLGSDVLVMKNQRERVQQLKDAVELTAFYIAEGNRRFGNKVRDMHEYLEKEARQFTKIWRARYCEILMNKQSFAWLVADLKTFLQWAKYLFKIAAEPNGGATS